MADALNYISVDDLSAEIQKHCDHEMLPSLLAELRGKQVASRLTRGHGCRAVVAARRAATPFAPLSRSHAGPSAP